MYLVGPPSVSQTWLIVMVEWRIMGAWLGTLIPCEEWLMMLRRVLWLEWLMADQGLRAPNILRVFHNRLIGGMEGRSMSVLMRRSWNLLTSLY